MPVFGEQKNKEVKKNEETSTTFWKINTIF